MTATHRPIRSFVLRQGRVSNAQRRAHDTLLPKFGIPYAPHPIDLDRAFGRSAPKVAEIGFGMGETTATIAAQHPENDYLGIEVHTPGVGSLLKRIAELNLTNVRIIQHDAVELLQNMIAPEALDAVHIFFPDPWPKKRHHKRRIIQPESVALFAQKLKRGGVLHLATDWEEYAQHMLAVVSAEPALINRAGEGAFAERPESRPSTKFERRGQRLGHRVWDLVLEKR